MNNNMNDITRVGLTANQLKNQFPDLIKFESELFENEYFANESKVGKRTDENSRRRQSYGALRALGA